MDYIKGKLISKTFKKAGETWKLYTLVIEEQNKETNAIEQNNYSCFDTLGTKEGSKSLTLDKLEENKEYSFGITSNDKGKTISFAQLPRDNDKGDKKTQATNKYFGKEGEIQKVKINFDAEPYKQFNIDYVKLMHEAKKEINLNHYAGYFIRTFRNELALQELALFLENEFETQVKKEAELNIYDEEIKL